MTTSVTDRTVGQIAAEFPASVRVFEKHGIDFCCGGKLPVTEACARKGLDPVALAAEIERSLQAPSADATDWLGAPLSDLVDHILDTHHAYMKVQLPVVEARLAKVLAAHGENHGEMLRSLSAIYGAMKAELDGHLAKEEMVLFPLVRALEGGAPAGSFHCGSVQNPIRVMCMEHDSAGDALVQIIDRQLHRAGRRLQHLSGVVLRVGGDGARPAPPHSPGKQHSVPPGDGPGIEFAFNPPPWVG